MRRFFYALALLYIASCCAPRTDIPDIGAGFGCETLHAPWHGLDASTRFTCHSTADRFFFSFDAVDSTLTLTEPFTNERDVDPEDRVEFFFSPAADLSEPYYCAEIDPHGRVMDYKAQFYRDFDFGWGYRTLEARGEITPWGYRVAGSVSREELASLGIDLDGVFWFGVFQGDYAADGSVRWFSYVPQDVASPDFHQSGVFFPCRMTPRQESPGVVIYPGDVKTVGIAEWERRLKLSGIRRIGLHAATVNDPVDSLAAFVQSPLGQEFLGLCKKLDVDVEYEIHAIESLLPRGLYAEHPEWFRCGEEGTRVADYNLCFTNPEVIAAIRPQLEKMLEWMKPTTHRYYLWPDDKEWKYCCCEQCSAYSPSEQTLIFENRLLALLREYDPEATLAHLAYHQTLPAPHKVRASEGVFLEFAPILRDYANPLTEEEMTALQENLLAFPAGTQAILEYWLDASMYARWKKDTRNEVPFNKDQCRRDIDNYRSFGATEITTFATWIDGAYINRFGDTGPLFRSYGESFKQDASSGK